MLLLIGAASFIGVHTAHELIDNGCDLIVAGRNGKFKNHYSRLGVGYIDFDLSRSEDIDKLPTESVDGVIVTAGMLPANSCADLNSSDNAADYFELNVISTIRLLEYCRANGISRLLQFSSYADTINSWSANRALTEDEPRSYRFTGDHAVYVFSKNAMVDVMEYYNQQHGMKNIVFRLPPVLGVGPHGSLMVNGTLRKSGLQIFMEKARSGDTITVFGDKNLSRDVVYVKDVARAVRMAMGSAGASGLYNMTAGRGVTLQEQAEVIARVFASSPDRISRIEYDPSVENNAPSFLFCMDKARRDFGYEPYFTDFSLLMSDFKKDIDLELYRDLFNY
ncbi:MULTISPECIES: NAD(P)-dependent oxidoreductase [unclassified Adlercreutzia]|uniref:NAD-dependent epimerase/dehydratase family protein n=1 Tax=unclassified Adlercreutzia TaxID=2636013 RepID=UPI0013E9A66D|nr:MULTISPECIES: NAD(P)-dependent oxidoreductase [unclassified Adlercreutzia]